MTTIQIWAMAFLPLLQVLGFILGMAIGFFLVCILPGWVVEAFTFIRNPREYIRQCKAQAENRKEIKEQLIAWAQTPLIDNTDLLILLAQGNHIDMEGEN